MTVGRATALIATTVLAFGCAISSTPSAHDLKYWDDLGALGGQAQEQYANVEEAVKSARQLCHNLDSQPSSALENNFPGPVHRLMISSYCPAILPRLGATQFYESDVLVLVQWKYVRLEEGSCEGIGDGWNARPGATVEVLDGFGISAAETTLGHGNEAVYGGVHWCLFGVTVLIPNYFGDISLRIGALESRPIPSAIHSTWDGKDLRCVVTDDEFECDWLSNE